MLFLPSKSRPSETLLEKLSFVFPDHVANNLLLEAMLNNSNDRKRSQGYDRIALLFASDPSIAIFRRFDRLNAENLLYYQAELAQIEHDLEYIIADDKSCSDEERHRYCFSVEDVKRSSGSTNPEQKSQWLKFLEARELLEKYSKL